MDPTLIGDCVNITDGPEHQAAIRTRVAMRHGSPIESNQLIICSATEEVMELGLLHGQQLANELRDNVAAWGCVLALSIHFHIPLTMAYK